MNKVSDINNSIITRKANNTTEMIPEEVKQSTSAMTSKGRQGEEYVDKLSQLVHGVLIDVEKVVSPVKRAINLGMVIINTKKTDKIDTDFVEKTVNALNRILDLSSPKNKIHFVIGNTG